MSTEHETATSYDWTLWDGDPARGSIIIAEGSAETAEEAMEAGESAAAGCQDYPVLVTVDGPDGCEIDRRWIDADDADCALPPIADVLNRADATIAALRASLESES